jgi:hypothetical protein
MIKKCLLVSTILAGALTLSIPASAVTIGGGAVVKLQPIVSDSTSDSTLLIQVRGSKETKSGAKGKGKGGGDVDDDDDDDDQGDDNDDQGEDDDDQGDDEQ